MNHLDDMRNGAHVSESFHPSPPCPARERLPTPDNSHWTKVTVFPDSFRVRGVTFSKGDPVVVTSRVTGEEFHGEITVVKPKAVGRGGGGGSRKSLSLLQNAPVFTCNDSEVFVSPNFSGGSSLLFSIHNNKWMFLHFFFVLGRNTANTSLLKAKPRLLVGVFID